MFSGYRLYRGLDDRLHLDQIVGGRVYPLQPNADDAERPVGFYGPDFKYLGEEEPEAAEEPEA
jgi:hypothetical protein